MSDSKTDPTQPAWKPPSIEQIARITQLFDARAMDDQDVPMIQAAHANAATNAAISLALIQLDLHAIAAHLAHPPVTATVESAMPSKELIGAVSALTKVVAEIDVKQRSVEDVATDGLTFGRRVDALAILDQRQVQLLLDAAEVLAPWILEQAGQPIPVVQGGENAKA